VAQGFLIDAHLGDSLRTMTRWTLMGALGDLTGPALVAAIFALGMGWRALFWAGALIWLVAFVALAVQRLPVEANRRAERADEAGEAPHHWRDVLANVALALRTPLLLRWLLLDLLPTFLDELFLAFAALYLQDRLAMSPAAISVALGVHITGVLLGLLLINRFGHHFQPQRLLGWLALIVLAGLLLLVLAPSPLAAIIALWITGVGVSGWYPIIAAEAYRTLPGRSGTVRAISSLVTPLEVIAPLLIGLAAEHWGIQAGIALLMLAPLALLLARPRKYDTTSG
jgi:predicted MFS family arabinose efflux permease